MTGGGVWIYYHGIVIALLLATLASLVANLFVFRSLRPVVLSGTQPLVSILVPARNEERCVAACVRSLAAQDYPNFELLVLDDHSEDGTAGILRELGFHETNPKLRLLSGQALPPGWTGKAWACRQLAAQAKGDHLFFTDADTEHSAGTLAAALAHARKTNADLLSAWPRLLTITWSEKLVIPMLHVLGGACYSHALVALLQSRPALAKALPRTALRALGAANGQFLFFKKSAYEKIGGHAAVRDHLVEDVALGREIAMRMGEGMRFVNCDGSPLATCRMYSSFAGVWEGFTKNVRPAFENSLAVFLLVGLIQFCCFLLPFVWIFVPGSLWRFAACEVGLVYLIRLILTIRFRTSWFGFVFHPFGQLLAMLIALNSWRHSAGDGVTWKGRVYSVGNGQSH